MAIAWQQANLLRYRPNWLVEWQQLALLLARAQILQKQLGSCLGTGLGGCLGSDQRPHRHITFFVAHWLQSILAAIDGVDQGKSIALYQELWGLYWL